MSNLFSERQNVLIRISTSIRSNKTLKTLNNHSVEENKMTSFSSHISLIESSNRQRQREEKLCGKLKKRDFYSISEGNM